MKEIALVTQTDGKKAKVKLDKKDECSKCGMCMFPKGAKSTEITAINKVNAGVGDKVTIVTQGKTKSLGIVLVFLVPLLLIVAGALVGVYALSSELWALGLSVGGVAVWYFILAFIDKKISKTAKFYAEIIEIVTPCTNQVDENPKQN